MAGTHRVAIALLLAIGVASVPSIAQTPKAERKVGRFSHQHSNLPDELQFGDFGQFDKDEAEFVKALAKGEPHEKVAAARVLWEGHSRRQATYVLVFLAGSPPGGDGFRKLQRDVEACFQPQAVLRELKEGDYLWGCWLAFLRPHQDLVPALLAGIKDQPTMLVEAVLALGNSGDPRAKEPLVELLQGKANRPAMAAARALGYLGGAEAELIEALAHKNDEVKVNACGALARTGGKKAIPALEKLATEDRDTGFVNVKGTARYAIDSINKREKR